MYKPRYLPESRFLDLRGLNSHVLCWGDQDKPLVVMVHGWMDMAASFQFVVDSLLEQTAGAYRVVALDWRGFGQSDWPVAQGCPGVRSYWFPDYLADLDALLDQLSPDRPVHLVGHSMGGNIAMLYAGVRPERIKTLVNLEGFGMLDSPAEKAPTRYAKWLDELKIPHQLRDYPDLNAVAARLQKTNARLSTDKALFLAQYWAKPVGDAYQLLGDPAHKIMNPIGYRLAEAQASWAAIKAPVLHVEAAQTEAGLWLSKAGEPVDFDAFRKRFDCVKDWRCSIVQAAGHMLHHDQPVEVARLLSTHFQTRP
ncbi:alpha/beta hydrolase [Limnobacter humi]|uniref:Alpha/beta hydrolase n=1 Tax=Limnobacter humi TaxID=1778671 RepID=A0ABT1WJU9_9BURK|nr:alpha/beta hydrolase [Limnobacter humi]MCQ8897785.1 alpha/beta hydrolase [Limnobacter humi]